MKTDIHPIYGFNQVWEERSFQKENDTWRRILNRITWPGGATASDIEQAILGQINEQILDIIWEDLNENATFVNINN